MLTEVICETVNGMPTMTLFLQALMANMARAFEHRTICPPGRSRNRCITSSRSNQVSVSAMCVRMYCTFHVKRRALADGLSSQHETAPFANGIFGVNVDLETILLQNIDIFHSEHLIGSCQLQGARPGGRMSVPVISEARASPT